MAKRMALIPEELVSSYQLQKPELRLEDEIVNLLDSKKIPDEMKAKLLGDLVTRYQRVVHEPKEPIRVTMDGQDKQTPSPVQQEGRPQYDGQVHAVLSSVPKPSAKFVPFILEKLKNNGISWNENGEMKRDNNVIKGGNIVDFFSYLMRNSKSQLEPKNFSLFFKAIKDAKIPTTWITNRHLSKRIDNDSPEVESFPQEISHSVIHNSEERQFSPTIRKKSRSARDISFLSSTPIQWRARSVSPRRKWLNY